MAGSEGAVWWGVFSSNNAQKVSAAVHTKLLSQLADGGAHVWLSGPAHLPAWRTDLLEISESRPDQEEALIPSYYPKNVAHKVWLKLGQFIKTERDWMMRHLEPAARPGKLVTLGNQTNLLIVRERSEPRIWWVNQGASWKRARDGGYIWAPTKNKQGHELPHWNAMKYLRTGDVVLH